jgi:hypothetical protein
MPDAAVGQTQQALECDCTIDGTCYEDGNIDPSNSCNVCNASTATDRWSRADTPACAAGLAGQYFATADLSGTPAFTRVDPTLHHDFYDSPGAPIGNEDAFSVRWTGQVAAPITDDYWFIFEGDEGGRVWVDSKLLADTWSGSTDRGQIHLDAGVRHDIKVEWHDTNERAFVRLVWHTDSGNVWWQGVPRAKRSSPPRTPAAAATTRTRARTNVARLPTSAPTPPSTRGSFVQEASARRALAAPDATTVTLARRTSASRAAAASIPMARTERPAPAALASRAPAVQRVMRRASPG